MLYERPFKEQFTHAMMRHYRPLVVNPPLGEAPSQRFRVSHCLDRVTVQLFNAPDATLKLAEQHRLLDALIGLLRRDISPWDEPDDSGADASGAALTPAASVAHAMTPAAAAAAAAAAAVAAAVTPTTPGGAAAVVNVARGGALMVDLARSVTEGRVYSRVLGDLRMVLAHPPVALHLLRERGDLVASLLGVLGALQGANGVARKWGEHVEEEGHAWVNAVSLEVSLVSLWAQLVEAVAECEPTAAPALAPAQPQPLSATPQPLLQAALAPLPPPPPRWDMRATALARAAAAALRAAAAWSVADAGAVHFSLDTHPVSVHLPLHRAAALAVGALLRDLPREAGGMEAAAALLRGDAAAFGLPPCDDGTVGPLCVPAGVTGLVALMRHPARVAAWASAVRARLWVRNGAEVSRLEHVYGSPFWAETGLDADLGLMQLCLAAASSGEQADALAAQLLADSGVEEIIEATEGESSDAGGAAPGAAGIAAAAAMTSEEEEDSDAADSEAGDVAPSCATRALVALRLCALLARERGLLAPQPLRAALRHAVVHWLAVGDLTHSALCAQLPAAAPYAPDLGAVLAEVARFVAPASAERAGHYALRPAAWAEWDPHFPHYTRTERETATARAQRLAQPPWRHATALRPPSVRPAPPFAALARFLRGPTVLRACAAAMRYAAAAQPATAAGDDLALEAMQLLALAAADATAAPQAEDAVATLAASLAAPGAHGEASLLKLVCDAAAAACAASAGAGVATDDASGVASAPGGPSAAVCDTAVTLLSDLRARGLAPPAPVAAAAAAGGAPLADAAAAAREERRRAMRERQRAVLAAMAAQQRAFAAKTEAAEAEEEHERRRSLGVDTRMAAGASSDEDEDEEDDSGSGSGSSSSDMSDATDEEEEEAEEGGGCALCRGDASAADGDTAADALCWVTLAQRSNIPALAARPPTRGWRWAQLEGGARGGAGGGAETPVGAATAAVGAAAAAAAAAGAAAAAFTGGSDARGGGDTGSAAAPPRPRGLERTLSAAALAARRVGTFEAAAASTAAAAAAAAAAPPPAPPFAAAPGVHVAVCGHRVHAACIARYTAALRASFASGRHFPGEYLLAVEEGQFLCPVCRRLANGVLPALPALQRLPAPVTPLADDDAAMEVDGDAGHGAAHTPSLGEAAPLEAVAAAARRAALAPPPAPDALPVVRSADGDTLAPLRYGSLGSGSLGSSLTGSRMLRRRSSAAAAALTAASADAAADRFADRCRELMLPPRAAGAPPPAGHACVLWAVLTYNVAHWETAARPIPGAAAAAAASGADGESAPASARVAPARSPQWVAMQALCRMALRAAGAPPPSGGRTAPTAPLPPPPPPPAAAAEALLSWLNGGNADEPPSALLSAFPGTADDAAAAAAPPAQAHAPTHGAELLRVLLAGMRTPATAQMAAAMEMLRNAAVAAERDVGGDLLPATDMEEEEEEARVASAAAAVASAAAAAAAAAAARAQDVPRVGRLLAAGDAFALFCELVAASAAAHNAAAAAAGGAAAGAQQPWCVWEPGRARALARLAASVAVAQAAAATGAAAAGDAVSVTPLEALLAVADVACGDDATAAAPLLQAVSRRCVTALRRCAILAALLEGATPPAATSDEGADPLAPLALPSLRALLAGVSRSGAAGAPALRRWLLLPPDVSADAGAAVAVGVPSSGGRDALRAWLATCPGGGAAAMPAAPRAPTLLALPLLYQDLFLEWADRPCAVCRRVPHEPALCLACGRLVCCAGACCAEPTGRRECAAHAAACGAGAAVFLLVKATKLLLLRGGRRCLYPSPYLDAHGEEDAYLHRGRPLYLNAARYAHVQRLWASASFDYDTHALHTSRGGSEHF
jgi:hypothetical protein